MMAQKPSTENRIPTYVEAKQVATLHAENGLREEIYSDVKWSHGDRNKGHKSGREVTSRAKENKEKKRTCIADDSCVCHQLGRERRTSREAL